MWDGGDGPSCVALLLGPTFTKPHKGRQGSAVRLESAMDPYFMDDLPKFLVVCAVLIALVAVGVGFGLGKLF